MGRDPEFLPGDVEGKLAPRMQPIYDNMPSHEVKTITTRAGEGSKVVLTGNPEQIDNPYIGASSHLL